MTSCNADKAYLLSLLYNSDLLASAEGDGNVKKKKPKSFYYGHTCKRFFLPFLKIRIIGPEIVFILFSHNTKEFALRKKSDQIRSSNASLIARNSGQNI